MWWKNVFESHICVYIYIYLDGSKSASISWNHFNIPYFRQVGRWKLPSSQGHLEAGWPWSSTGEIYGFPADRPIFLTWILGSLWLIEILKFVRICESWHMFLHECDFIWQKEADVIWASQPHSTATRTPQQVQCQTNGDLENELAAEVETLHWRWQNLEKCCVAKIWIQMDLPLQIGHVDAGKNTKHESRSRAHTRSILHDPYPDPYPMILRDPYPRSIPLIHTLDPYPFLVEERLMLALMLLFILILLLVLVLLLPLLLPLFLLLPPLPLLAASVASVASVLLLLPLLVIFLPGAAATAVASAAAPAGPAPAAGADSLLRVLLVVGQMQLVD